MQTTSVSLPAALAQANPDQTDRALEASLTSLLGSKPVPIWEDKVSEGGWDGVVTGYRLPKMTAAVTAQAIALAEKSLMPMTQNECIGLLGELRLLVPPVNMTEQTMEAQLLLYSRKLSEYPADVVRKVLTTQPNMSRFWPSWSELKERLDIFTARRLRLLDALKSPTTCPTSRTSSAAPEPPTDPELWAKAQAILAARRERKADAETMPDMTPEELEAKRAEVLAQCEQ